MPIDVRFANRSWGLFEVFEALYEAIGCMFAAVNQVADRNYLFLGHFPVNWSISRRVIFWV